MIGDEVFPFEIAKILDVSNGRVSQIKSNAINLAYLMAIYLMASVYYLVMTAKIGTPFKDSLTPTASVRAASICPRIVLCRLVAAVCSSITRIRSSVVAAIIIIKL